MVFVFFAFCLLVFEIFIKIDSPAILNEKVDTLKNDSLLMTEIGGYRKYEYTYNEKQLSSDTMQFEIIIYGSRRNLINRGQAIRNIRNEWEIVNDEINIYE